MTNGKSRPGNFYVYVEDCDAAYKKALAAGGKSLSEPQDQFYGDRHGGVTDAQGNNWWIATHIEDVRVGGPGAPGQRAQEKMAAAAASADKTK